MIEQGFLESNRNLTKAEKYLYTLENVIVDTKTGLVLDEKGIIKFELAYEVLYWGPPIKGNVFDSESLLIEEICKRYRDKANEVSEALENSDDITNLDPKNAYIYLLHPVGWYPYGHLHDSLNRLFSCKNESIESPKLLCSRFNKINDFDLHIRAYGYDSSAIVNCTKLPRFIRVPKLLYPVNPSFYTSFRPDVYEWVLNGYSSALSDSSKKYVGERYKLYLTRNHVVNGARGVVNDEEVKDYLLKQGFKVLSGTESLKEIFHYFSNSQCIIAPHGSILVNTIFCPSDSKILEFCPANRIDYSFKNKYKHATQYEHVLVEADSRFNISLDLEVIKSFLGKL